MPDRQPTRRRRIARLLFSILLAIAVLVLVGIGLMTDRLLAIQNELTRLRDVEIPRLVKIAQLSQEAAATIAIAPAMSANPTRYEFETLLSRIEDKRRSQRLLIEELEALVLDAQTSGSLDENGGLLAENLESLTSVVSSQIEARKTIDGDIEYLRRIVARSVPDGGDPIRSVESLGTAWLQSTALQVLQLLFDPNAARFSRNSRQTEESTVRLRELAGSAPTTQRLDDELSAYLQWWSGNGVELLARKSKDLADEFRIKALVEENSLIANRLLGAASNEFWTASERLEREIAAVGEAARIALSIVALVAVGFLVGAFLLWIVLKSRVLDRLSGLRDSLYRFAEHRDRPSPDAIPDEIGEISAAMIQYMTEIERREGELSRLSNQLSKYLSPQVYDSIFKGEKQVAVVSSRKKLTVYFSDIVGFTEASDRLESEEMTALLNRYLTEMSRIALEHGATIDKYIGDAVMIFFGDPESRGVREDALACLEMAIAMRERVLQLGGSWRDSGVGRELQVRAGIHTGYCTVGNFGSEDRMDYTIIGSAVNIASRLESMADPGQILISSETHALVRDTIQCRERGEVEVRGISHPVGTHVVLDRFDGPHRDQTPFRHQSPNLSVDVRSGAMSEEERIHARRILEQALETLDHS